jgi:hypothetical protein
MQVPFFFPLFVFYWRRRGEQVRTDSMPPSNESPRLFLCCIFATPTYICIFIYIHTQRERERERELSVG